MSSIRNTIPYTRAPAYWPTPFVFKNLLNKKIQSSKIIFLLPGIVCESTDLYVVKKVLVDAERSMENFGTQVLSIHYFLGSASSETTTNLLFV